ncbi:MAG: efflux RND transporter permease subunit [Candidatus Omnitrophica bacterium]|nr:efflux RND transporter permease subunit [Candidatus Omnitrophota bacterium]
MIEKLIEFSSRNRFLVFFITGAAILLSLHSLKNIPLDAIPDLSDTQVIVYSRWDRSPDIIEDQVTYPIVSSLLGVPRVKDVRALSDFGFSYVYVIFEDGTDVYWARSRVLEYLSKIQPSLPEGVKTELGPDATGVGWVYQYALIDRTGKHSLEALRSYQDWNLRYAIQSVPGVSEVASIGGFQKQYQIQLDPNKLFAYGISITEVADAVRKGNSEVGGRLIELSGAEYMIRGRGYARSVSDFENIVIRSDAKGTPLLIKDVATVMIGPDIRRGISDLDGEGDAVGGIVIMRYHENALNVIRDVKERLEDLKRTLPEGMEVIPVYDRSELIERSIDTLKHQLIEEMIIVSAVILIFLWHVPSAIIPIITIPIAVLLAFIPLYRMGITSNIMSLAGIAISIGVLVDGAIVEVENAYNKLEKWQSSGGKGDYHAVRLDALKQVGPSVFFSLLVIAVAFMPIFTLVDQEGRLFKPLALSKNIAMAIAALLAVTLDPALRMSFSRMEPFSFRPKFLSRLATTLCVGKYHPEEKHPVSRQLFRVYEPVVRWTLRFPKTTMIGAALVFILTIPFYFQLGSEFMPPLNEGAILYMPTTLPGISVAQAQQLMQTQDKILKSFPEVERVFGKAGRAETATDPAPLSMMETTVILKPKSQWRRGLDYDRLIDEMDQKLQIPGVTNAWTMPIKNRIDMLSTGIRTPIGIKIHGDDLHQIEKTGLEIEAALKNVRGTRSIFAERVTGGYFLDFTLKRQELARYGLSVEDANAVIMTAIGGESISTTVEGRERYSVNVRYARDFRDDLESLGRVLVQTPLGAQVSLSHIADLQIVQGPAMIRDENGRLTGYVYVDVAGRDVGGYVKEAKKLVESSISVPKGTYLVWSGQYENMNRVKQRLLVIVPITILLIMLLLYLNTKSWIKTGIVLLAVPFSLVGAIWLLFILGYNVSIATWVGMIALMGLDAETGVFMLLYLDLAYQDAVKAGKMKTAQDLEEAIIHGAVKRIRPKLMTVMAAMMGLMPIMWSMGTGADLMKRIAAPMIGGLLTSFVMELLVYPPVYALWKRKSIASS